MMRFSTLALAVAVLWAPATSADDQLPADLAAVPSNAIGFLHLKLADLWKSELLKDLRVSIERAGPKAIEAFDSRFMPRPSSIDRLTIIMLDPTEGGGDPPFVGIVTCNEAFDKAKVIQSLLPMGKETKVGNRSFVADPEQDIGIYVMNDRTFAVATPAMLIRFLDNKPVSPNPFAAALAEAAGKQHIVGALNASLIPAEAIAELPEPIQPLARARLAQVSIHFGEEIQTNLRLRYGDETQAKSGEAAAREGVKMARETLQGLRTQFERQLMPMDNKGMASLAELPEAAVALATLGAIQVGDEYLKNLPLKREQESLVVSVNLPSAPLKSVVSAGSLAVGFALPAVQKARMAATRSRTANNLKQIMLAMYNYHDTYNGFPPAAICDKNGKPLLSWRVALLPFIEQDNLYKQFRLDEPWDSEHNKKLLALMPQIYAVPNATKPGDTLTHFRIFHGNGAALELKKNIKLFDYRDGTSNTAVVFETEEGVEWTKPDLMEYDPQKPLPKFGKSSPDGFWVAMGDGSVRFLKKTTPQMTLRALITRSGGEVIPFDD